jgi:quinol monooxygenase YgiN
MTARTKLAHIVYFTLKESTPENVEALIAACDKYLSGHPGTLYYSAGSLVPDLTREVNQRDWDVALHVVFESREAHDVYQTAPRHLQFIEENKATWAKVRVFDSYVA